MNVTEAVSKPAAPATERPPATVLCVDDEANILKSLNRLFRRSGYRVICAEGGEAGLEVLGREAVDLVVSDMRMPGMDGAQFLTHVAERWPAVMRILLTGYADLSSAVAAINNGKIFRYLSKPWNDDDLLVDVRQALEVQFLERERHRLTALTERQNAELKDLNANLEQKVQARTHELRATLAKLQEANRELKDGYVAAIKTFARLIEMRQVHGTQPARMVGERAHRLALALGMAEAEAQDVLFAALLRDIGKIGFSDDLMNRPFNRLSPEELERVRRYPLDGQAALMALEPLQGAARLIRSHRERINGSGFPDGLLGNNIPLGARILAVVGDYFALTAGMLERRPLGEAAACEYLVQHRGTHYDAQVVDAFVELFGKAGASQVVSEPDIHLAPDELEPGMVLSRDLLSENGVVWLPRGHLLDAHLVARIRQLAGPFHPGVHVRFTRV